MSSRKRRPSVVSQSSSGSSSPERPPKRTRQNEVRPCEDGEPIRVFLVTAKISSEDVAALEELVRINDSGTGKALSVRLCNNVDEADAIVTCIRIRKRLERHVDWKLAEQKAILTPQWLIDSINIGEPLPCGDYAAIRDLHDETVKNCPDDAHREDDGESSRPTATSSAQALLTPPSSPRQSASTTRENLKLPRLSRYSCQRISPLVCPNQELVRQLSVIMHSREVEGERINALSYERAIASVKAYPHIITEHRLKEVEALPFIGDKAILKIKEFLRSGHISETKTILASERYQALSAFNTVYGIGPEVARVLYEARGLRTMNQLRRYYDIHEETLPAGPPLSGDPPDLSIQDALLLVDDLNKKIQRDEVEAIRSLVMDELASIGDGYISTIAGGYRRGKPESNDVDIIISHRDTKLGRNAVNGLSKTLVKRLYAKGIVKHVMHLSSFRAPHALRTAQWDTLEKALTVLIFPPDPSQPELKRINRRVDLIFAAPESYWTAVVGWTGSKMFQRDLRKWAKEKLGLKFDSSGITRRHDSKVLVATSERDVFRILNLEWIPPELRNADV